MKKWVSRICYGLLFAIPLMLVTYAFAQASPPVQESLPAGSSAELDCQGCHPAFQAAWEAGIHGNAGKTETFLRTWKEQGQPSDCLKCHMTGLDPQTGTWETAGVACERCHSPIPANHPAEPMPVNRSAQLCGDCHTETFFEWQASLHRTHDLGCSTCHDPHGNQLKADTGSVLCASCHKARASNFTHTAHSQRGLQCNDCHMADLHSTGVEGHARKDHSFFVSLTSCNACHAYEMHDPIAVHPEPTPTVDSMASVETLSVVSAPEPASPLGFAVLAGLIGLAVGVVIAPWLERFRNKSTLDGEKGD